MKLKEVRRVYDEDKGSLDQVRLECRSRSIEDNMDKQTKEYERQITEAIRQGNDKEVNEIIARWRKHHPRKDGCDIKPQEEFLTKSEKKYNEALAKFKDEKVKLERLREQYLSMSNESFDVEISSSSFTSESCCSKTTW